MKVGDISSLTKVFTKEDIVKFSGFSLDSNPIHFDESYAANTQFKACIAQGPMVASLIGGVLGSRLPGNGTIYLSQSSKFLKAVFVNDEVTAHVQISNIRIDKPIITLRTWVTNQHNEIILDGEAVVLYLKP